MWYQSDLVLALHRARAVETAPRLRRERRQSVPGRAAARALRPALVR